MARRRNSIAKRFAKMRGLPPEEKALMQRIGNLMDAALNNRQASNPFEQSTTRFNRQVYPPTGLLAQSGIASVKIIWNPANSNEHLRYEIEFLNLTTGKSITKTSFTNEIVFRDDVGAYIAKVASVGRDGSKSSLKEVEFNLGKDVMLIEGAKHGATELGTVIQDNIQLYKGFSIYIWGSVVLDKQTLDTNNKIVFRLWRAEIPDATFGVTPMTLEQTITLYPATESGSSLDTTARAGLISRPIVARPGAFETSQSVMFSPIAVDDADDEKVVTYFLQAINRGVEQDEVALSLTIWAGMDGVGSGVPGDVFVPPTPYVWPNLNSFHNQTPLDSTVSPFDKRSAHAVINDGHSLIGNEWTIALWIRFDSLDAQDMSAGGASGNDMGNEGTKYLFTRGTIANDDVYQPNQIQITVRGINNNPGFSHELAININGSDKTLKTVLYQGVASGDNNEISGIFPYGDALRSSTASKDSTNNGWYFIVICFGGGDFTDTLVPKIRTYINNGVDGITGLPNDPPTMALLTPTTDNTTEPIIMNDEGRLGYQMSSSTASFTTGKYFAGAGGVAAYTGDLANVLTIKNMQYHQLGMWNIALDSDATGQGGNIGPINALYNGGHGTEVDWKQNVGTLTGIFAIQNYIQSENLIHLIQFGAVEKAFSSLETLRDTGYFLPNGDMNFTQDERDNEYWRDWHLLDESSPNFHKVELPSGSGDFFLQLGQSWMRGSDIYDILSPTGSNNTTQYDWAYPGQNLPGATIPWPPV